MFNLVQLAEKLQKQANNTESKEKLVKFLHKFAVGVQESDKNLLAAHKPDTVGVSFTQALGTLASQVGESNAPKPMTTAITAPKALKMPSTTEKPTMAGILAVDNPGETPSINQGREVAQADKPKKMSKFPKVMGKVADALDNPFFEDSSKAVGAAMEGAGKSIARKAVASTAAKAAPEISSKLLSTVFSKAPVISQGISAINVGQRLGKGDLPGAGIALASGVVGSAPPFGTAASVALDGYNAYRDAEKDKLSRMQKVDLKHRQSILRNRMPAGNIEGLSVPAQPVKSTPVIEGLAEPKVGYCRSTGVFDSDGGEYVNSEDVRLLGKLGFILDISEYSALEKTGEVLDQYSYVEKIAGVPKAVVKAIDKGEAFSGEFLKDMDYSVPKGYEMKGDLCCPIEKEKKAEAPASNSWSPELLNELTSRIAKDQSFRTGNSLTSQAGDQNIDKDNVAWLKPHIDKFGLPVGQPGKDVGLITQHADFDPDFQENVLQKMRTHNQTNPGTYNGQTIAHLDDRINVNRNRPQMYGSQGGEVVENGKWVWKPKEIFEPNNLENRRKEVGLMPHKEYSDLIHKHFISKLPAPTPAPAATPTKVQPPLEKGSSLKPGLWDNIRAKKARGEKAAKPGDEDYPDKKQWDKLSKAAEYGNTLTPNTAPNLSTNIQPAPLGVNQNVSNMYGNGDTPYGEKPVKNPYPGIIGDAGVNVAESLAAMWAKKMQSGNIEAAISKGALGGPSGPPVPPGSGGTPVPGSSLLGKARMWGNVARSVPLVGAGAQLSGANDRRKDGDYPGMLIDGVGALGSAAQVVPHPEWQRAGLAVSYASTAANAARDVHKYNNRPVVFRRGDENIKLNAPEKPVQIPQQPQLAKAGAQIEPLLEQLRTMMNKQAAAAWQRKKEAEYRWHKSKDLHRDVTNGRHYPFSFLTGEAKELVDAIKNRDMANFKEEIGDTSYAAQMLAAQLTGLNHPVYADLSKFYDREKVWKEMFKEKGSSYHPKHMEGGSNYAKASKIIKAFSSAGIKVDQKEAERLANHYTGGKMEKEAAGMPAHMWKAVQEKNAPMIASAARKAAATRAKNKAARELKRLINIDGSVANAAKTEAPWQDMFHFDRSHLFEQLKKTIDPAYVVNKAKYLGRP